MSAKAARVGRPQRRPCARGQRQRVVAQGGRRHGGQALELIGAQLAEAAEVRDAEVLADADEGDALGGHVQLGEPSEDLRDLQLVVEIGLEPQQVVPLARGREGGVALLEGAPLRLEPSPVVGLGEEARADGAQLRVADVGHRALVKDVAPHDDPLDERRLQQRGGRRVAVGHVQPPRARACDQLLPRRGVGSPVLAMRSRTRRLKSACLVMLVSGAIPRGPPATGEAGAVDDHASPVREVDLPLPPRRARLERAIGGWARTAAGRRC